MRHTRKTTVQETGPAADMGAAGDSAGVVMADIGTTHYLPLHRWLYQKGPSKRTSIILRPEPHDAVARCLTALARLSAPEHPVIKAGDLEANLEGYVDFIQAFRTSLLKPRRRA